MKPPTEKESIDKKALNFPLPDLELIKVQGQQKDETFKMGGIEFDWEKPIHEVHIGYFYYIGRFQRLS